MDKLLENLYFFVTENCLAAHRSDPKYRQAQELQVRHRRTLEKLLDDQDRKALELYDEAVDKTAELESAALFRAGLRMGLELSRI